MDSEPQPPTAGIHEDENKKLPIKTYHCRFCSHLLIASTRELLSARTPLRRRRQVSTIEGGAGGGGGEGVGGLDGAMILELPSDTNTTTRAHKKRKSYDSEGRGEMIPESGTETEKEAGAEKAATGATAQAAAATKQADDKNGGKKRTEQQAHYTIPLSTLLPDQTPIIIRREDGFEKRVLLRCGRCRVVVGYKLHNTAGPTTDEDIDEEDENGLTTKGKGEKAIYLLPGSIVGTEDLDVGLTEAEAEAEGTEGGRKDMLNAMIDRNPVLKGMEGEWMEWIK